MGQSRRLAKLAADINVSGNITADAIASDVTLGGATIYSARSNLPTSGNTAGDQAYVTENNRLYIWNGSGWYNVALLNLAPAISSVLDSDSGTTPFGLSTDGTATTITITATDSDGDPLTYEYSTDSDFSGLATISQDTNVFTITPFSEDSATTGSGTITFTATDGVNVASSGVQTFTLLFGPSFASSSLQDIVYATSGSGSYDATGYCVDIDGDTIIAGAPAFASTFGIIGCAYVFTRSNGTWTQQAQLSQAGTTEENAFSVQIDGDRAVTGDFSYSSNTGRINIWDRSGTSWSADTSIGGSSGNDRFGEYIALSGDTIAVTSPNATYFGTVTGKITIYNKASGSWVNEKTFFGGSDGYTTDPVNQKFGWHLDIDGDILVTGTINPASQEGRAWVFKRTGTSWSSAIDLTPSGGHVTGSRYGSAVAISGDTIAIGRNGSNSNNGSVVIWTTSDGGSTWTQQQEISNPDSGSNVYFGYAVALDGNNLAVHDVNSSGTKSIYMFNRAGSTWTYQHKITDDPGSIEYGDGGEISFAMSNDTVVVGAKNSNENPSYTGAGAVYVRVSS